MTFSSDKSRFFGAFTSVRNGLPAWTHSRNRNVLVSSNGLPPALKPQISEIFGFMSGKKMPAFRPGADSALKSCRRHDGERARVLAGIPSGCSPYFQPFPVVSLALNHRLKALMPPASRS